jgi:hypothetical protein
MADQRRPHSTAASAPRRGFIVFNGGFSTIDCVIRYTSALGANLDFENVEDVPAQFFLHIDDWTPSRQCVVIWRMGSVLGVEFEEDNIVEPDLLGGPILLDAGHAQTKKPVPVD